MDSDSDGDGDGDGDGDAIRANVAAEDVSLSSGRKRRRTQDIVMRNTMSIGSLQSDGRLALTYALDSEENVRF